MVSANDGPRGNLGPMPKAKTAKKSSGWVHDSERSTVKVTIRCSPEVIAAARALIDRKTGPGQRELTLAYILERGVEAVRNEVVE